MYISKVSLSHYLSFEGRDFFNISYILHTYMLYTLYIFFNFYNTSIPSPPPQLSGDGAIIICTTNSTIAISTTSTNINNTTTTITITITTTSPPPPLHHHHIQVRSLAQISISQGRRSALKRRHEMVMKLTKKWFAYSVI